MPYIEHTAELTLFGETVEVPLWIQYERHEAIPAISGGYGEPLIIPAEDEHCEIQKVGIIIMPGEVTEHGYTSQKIEPADWLLRFMTPDQRGEIENAILEELE